MFSLISALRYVFGYKLFLTYVIFVKVVIGQSENILLGLKLVFVTLKKIDIIVKTFK